jgi:hypothetical protein
MAAPGRPPRPTAGSQGAKPPDFAGDPHTVQPPRGQESEHGRPRGGHKSGHARAEQRILDALPMQLNGHQVQAIT